MDRAFTDKASGKDGAAARAGAAAGLRPGGGYRGRAQHGRLARNLDDLRRIVQGLTRRGVRIEFLKEGLAFTGDDSPMATLMLSVMGAFAEFERALLQERQREGITLARQRGAYRGRKPTLPAEKAASFAAVCRQGRRKPALPKSSASAAKRFTSISGQGRDRPETGTTPWGALPPNPRDI